MLSDIQSSACWNNFSCSYAFLDT